jgi:hypothetical protein
VIEHLNHITVSSCRWVPFQVHRYRYRLSEDSVNVLCQPHGIPGRRPSIRLHHRRQLSCPRNHNRLLHPPMYAH